MKKHILLLFLIFTGFLQAQTYPVNPTKFGKISLNTNGVSTSTTKINTQEADGQINYIDAMNLPVPTSVINAIKQKADLSTGLLKNGLISINADPTKFNISAGIGIISNFDDPENPVSTIISFPAFTGVTPTYLLTGNITYIAINSTPAVVMQATPFTDIQRRDLIILGAAIHSNLTNINVVNNISAPSNAIGNQLHDFMEAVGALNITGNKYSANGANLSLNKSTGTIFKFGVNFATNWKDPHVLSQSSGTALTFRYRTQNGTEGSDVTVINPALYDVANVLTAVPNNKFSIQTVTMFQSGITRIQYGQNFYDDLASAQAAIFTRDYNVEANIKENGITRAYIIVKNNTTSLQNATDSRIIEAQKFGGVASGGVALTFANIVSALGYTPENIANKAVDFTTVNNTLYPTVQASKDYSDKFNPIYFKGKDIEFFGDSYTSGSGASSTSNRWTTLISSALGAIEINHGVAGTTMEKRVPINYMASPNMVDNVVNIPTKTASKAMLVFAFGLNDMGQTAPAYSTENYKTDYQTVLNNAFSKGWLPNQVLIIPAYYIGSAGYAAYAAITGNAAPDVTRHLAFIQAAKEVADANGTMYFDIYQDQKKNDTSLISGDNIHPTNTGYAYIANDVLQYLGADKLSITTDTGYSSGSGFIPKINVNKLDNSFLYQNTIGIGLATIDPKAGLHIHSASANSTMLMSHTGTTDAIGRGVSLALDTSLNLMLNNRENGGVSWYTNNVERLGSTATGNTYVRNGNFGINITTPNFQQQVHNTAATDTYTQYTNSNTGSTSADGFLIGINSSQNVEVANKENGFMRFHTNNTEKLRIHASGGVSIGNTTDPGASNLNVTGTVTAATPTASTHLTTKGYVDGLVRPYKVYTALISQTGTSAPTATVLENTLGGTVTFSRTIAGNYLATLTGAFTINKTACFITSTTGTFVHQTNRNSTNDVIIVTLNSSNVATDALLNNTTFEIRVYL